MNLENELLEKFQVEELEKRYEFYWIEGIAIGTGVPDPHELPDPPPAGA